MFLPAGALEELASFWHSSNFVMFPNDITEIEEVPGARERPADSSIRISRSHERYIIYIPPAKPNILVLITLFVLTCVLLETFYTGAAFFVSGKSVHLMKWIADKGVTPQLRLYSLGLLPAWVVVLVAGMRIILNASRPFLTSETLTFYTDRIEYGDRFLNESNTRTFLNSNANSFVIYNDPHGLTSSTLKLIAGNEEVEIGMHVTDAERDWLESVGKVLLKRYP